MIQQIPNGGMTSPQLWMNLTAKELARFSWMLHLRSLTILRQING